MSYSSGFSPAAASKWGAANGLPTLANMLSGPRKIAIAGTSIDVGYNAAYPSGNIQGYRSAPVRRMRDGLIAAGQYAQDEAFQGTMGYTTAAAFAQFDTRMNIGAGWDFSATSSVNYGILQNSTTTTPFVFTPDTQCNAVTLWCRSTTGAAQISVTFGGVTKNLSLLLSPQDFVSVTIQESDGVVLGNNPVSIARVSGTCNISYVWARNSRLPAYQLLNFSSSGARMQHIANSLDAARPLYFPEQILSAGDEWWMAIGPNDWRDSADPVNSLATYRANMIACLDRRIAYGIKPRVIIPARTSVAAAAISNQDMYNQAMREIAAARSVPVYDFKDRWGEHAAALAKGLMVTDPDYFHPSWRGAGDIGQSYAQIAMAPQ